MKTWKYLFTLFCIGLGQLHAQSKLPVAQIIDTMVCKQDKRYTYSLYLPKGYSPTKKWSVIYIFDPSGKPIFPIKKLQKAADTYGYVLVGCYNYINGPADFKIISKVSADVSQQVSLHPKRMYTCGFSGGARYAFALSQMVTNIRGVITVGAGYFPNIPPRPDRPTDWVGVVGYLDFNWQEMNKLQKYLHKLKYPTTLLRYEGRHQWPSESVMTLAVACLELKAMQSQEIAKNKTVIDKIHQRLWNTALGFEKQGALHYAQQTYQELLHNLRGLTDLTKVKQKLEELENSEAYKKMRQKIVERQKEEQRLSNVYIKALGASLYPRQPAAKPLDWWQASYDGLYRVLKKSSDLQERHFVRRMFAFVIAGSLERAWLLRRKALMGDPKLAPERLLRIAHIFWQKNHRITMQLAHLYAQQGKRFLMYKFLKIAIKNGFKDKKALKHQVFDKWRKQKKFVKLVTSM
jgi:hypothetical protein